MAIHKNLWLRNTKQRLAGVVFYNRASETVSRELAAQVTNPRTQAQMAQRVKLANLVALYRANKGWLRDSAFEQKPRNWSVYNYLIHANLPQATVALTKQEAAAGACVAAPLFITQGSLPAVGYSVNDVGTRVQTDLYIGSDWSADEDNATIGELTKALLANNNGLAEGMQLSLVFNYQLTRPSTGMPYVVARYYELILDSTSTTVISDTDLGFHMNFVDLGDDTAHIEFAPDSDSSIWAAAVILSHTVGGKTYVSDADFTLNDTSVYARYYSAAHVAEATASYGDQSFDFLSTAPGNNRESNANVSMPLGIVSVNGRTAGQILKASDMSSNSFIVLTGPNDHIDEVTLQFQNETEFAYDDFDVTDNIITVPGLNIAAIDGITGSSRVTKVVVAITDGPLVSIDFEPDRSGIGSGGDQTE